MKSIVIVHPIVETKDQVFVEKGSIKNYGNASEINPWDLYAIEAAIRLKETFGGEITALSLGSHHSLKSLRRALAFGCDKAVLIRDSNDGFFNTKSTAHSLKNAIEKIGRPDLILGAYSYLDTGDATISVQLSRLLRFDYISLVIQFISLDEQNQTLMISRRLNEIKEVVPVQLPAIVTIDKEFGEPRYPSFYAMQRASKIEIEEIPIHNVDSFELTNGIEYSGLEVREWNRKECEYIKGDTPDEIAHSLIYKLKLRGE